MRKIVEFDLLCSCTYFVSNTALLIQFDHPRLFFEETVPLLNYFVKYNYMNKK